MNIRTDLNMMGLFLANKDKDLARWYLISMNMRDIGMLSYFSFIFRINNMFEGIGKIIYINGDSYEGDFF
jgi:hypothetical protein